MTQACEEVRPPTLRERLAPAMRLSCRLATRLIGVSQSVKNELVDLRFPEGKIIVRNNPRRSVSSPRSGDRAAARQRWGLAESNVVIGNVGHAIPVKGWDVLVRAFARVANQDERAKLLLVGSFQSDGERSFYGELKSWIQEQGLDDRIVFTGHVGEIGLALSAMDIFALPSRSEGFSFALIEGLEAGLPCVATRVGIAPEVIREGFNGCLVAREDEAGLAQALCHLVADPASRELLRRNASVPSCIPTPEEYGEQFARDCEALLAASH